MNIDIGQDETAEPGRKRAVIIDGLNRLIDDLAIMGEAGIPERITFQLPVPDGLGHEGKHAWLERVAAAWQVEVLPDGMGGSWAQKRSGPVRLVASVACPARGVFDYKERAAAHGLRSSIGANGATA